MSELEIDRGMVIAIIIALEALISTLWGSSIFSIFKKISDLNTEKLKLKKVNQFHEWMVRGYINITQKGIKRNMIIQGIIFFFSLLPFVLIFIISQIIIVFIIYFLIFLILVITFSWNMNILIETFPKYFCTITSHNINEFLSCFNFDVPEDRINQRTLYLRAKNNKGDIRRRYLKEFFNGLP